MWSGLNGPVINRFLGDRYAVMGYAIVDEFSFFEYRISTVLWERFFRVYFVSDSCLKLTDEIAFS